MKRLIVVLLALALLVPATASAFDRKPFHIAGLRPDGWGQTPTSAQAAIRERWGDARKTYCAGVLMEGHVPDSYAVHGTARYWDKLACIVQWLDGEHSVFVFDQKGPGTKTWISYRWQNLP